MGRKALNIDVKIERLEKQLEELKVLKSATIKIIKTDGTEVKIEPTLEETKEVE